MAKKTPAKKTKTKTKTKVVARAKPKPQPVEEKVESTLTKAEEFYIENNLTKTDEQLAHDLGKSLPVVRQHVHHTRGNSRINNLLVREKGCVVMTEGASMAADESRKRNVSQDALNRAIENQDFREAARLRDLITAQRKEEEQAAKERQAKHIHYINGER